VALCERNSGIESGRQLFKGSKDSASLLVCIKKKLFGWECGFLVSDLISGGLLGHLGQLYLALDANH